MRQIYFVRPIGMAGPIKIGCSKQVEFRIDGLATWSPYPLELIVTIEGQGGLERNIHECFADLHSHKEWFHPGKSLLEFIEKLKAGVPVDQAIDLSKRIAPIVAIGGKRPALPEMEGYRSYVARLRWAAVKASKIAGQSRFVTADASNIMYRWRTIHGYHWVKDSRRPTDAEFSILDQIIAEPAKFCVSHEVRFPKPKAVAA